MVVTRRSSVAHSAQAQVVHDRQSSRRTSSKPNKKPNKQRKVVDGPKSAASSKTSQAAVPSKPLPSDLPIHRFISVDEYESFLEDHHATSPGIYIRFAKKRAAGKVDPVNKDATITNDEALELSLCYGWINGWGQGIDDRWWLQRFTPRRPKSIWSQRNVGIVERLTADGRMRPSGLAAVEAAKEDGRWGKAYAGPATMNVPDDVAAALRANSDAEKAFAGLNRSDRYLVLWRIETALSAPTRDKRIAAAVSQLSGKKNARDK